MIAVQKSKMNFSVMYEVFISIMALIAVLTSLDQLNNTILILFWVDYIIRLITANNKKKFVKANLLDLIAILPFNSFLRAFRIAKLVKIIKVTKTLKSFKIFVFSKRLHSNIKTYLKTNGFIYMIYLTVFIIFISAIMLYVTENGPVIATFEDALWAAFCSVSLFGYEGIETFTMVGKLITGLLIITGIVFTGMFTATTVTFFRSVKNREKYEVRVVDLSDLDERQFNEVNNFIQFIRSK